MNPAVIKQRLATASPKFKTRIVAILYVTIVVMAVFTGLCVHGTPYFPTSGDGINVLTALKVLQLQTLANASHIVYAKAAAIALGCHVLSILAVLIMVKRSVS